MGVPFVTTTQTGTGNSSPVYVGGVAPTSVQCDVTGQATYSVQTTLNEAGAGQNWFAHPDPQTQNASGPIQTCTLSPVRAYRVVISAGSGSVTLTVGA